MYTHYICIRTLIPWTLCVQGNHGVLCTYNTPPTHEHPTEGEATNGALTVGNVHATSVLVLSTCAPVLLKPMHTASQTWTREEGTSLYTYLMSYTV